MLVTGVYVTIDGIFVGHYLGETGLAGMMLAYPVGAILYAIGAMIGVRQRGISVDQSWSR